MHPPKQPSIQDIAKMLQIDEIAKGFPVHGALRVTPQFFNKT